jgi:lipid A 3-O-deacylase
MSAIPSVCGSKSARALFFALMVALVGPTPFDLARADPMFFSSDLYDPTRFEFRAGVFGNVWGPEKNSYNVDASIVFPKFLSAPGWLPDEFVPRVQLGGMFNVNRKTDFGFADLVWTIHTSQRIFWEPFVGVVVHDGQLDGPDPTRASLGCRALIHAGFGGGYRFDSHWSVMASFDHSSNGKSLSHCPTNQSINLIGGRVGYAF